MLRSHRVRSILPLLTPHLRNTYATVSPSIINLGGLPPPPEEPSTSTTTQPTIPSALDRQILSASSSSENNVSLSDLVRRYLSNSGRVLDASLLYEPRPSTPRKINHCSPTANVLLVAHCIQDGDEHKVTVSSGFALKAASQLQEESLVVTCAHTFEEIRRSPLMLAAHGQSRRVSSGSFVICSEGIFPVTDIISSLPRSDLMIMSCKNPQLATLPVSPYPAHPGTRVLGHLVSHEHLEEPGWSPWIRSSWSKWVGGTVLGYRDFAGRETKPGTYDALSHLLFSPLPTAGSSGGPIVDEETGAVIGVMLGTRMDNRVEGTRGWGVPSETIFEMFSLPGLEGKK